MSNAFHITHVENMAEIWNAGYLVCDDSTVALGQAPISIAFENIKSRRRTKLVNAGPGGVLSNYVPFYFANRSPMLSTVFYRDREQGTCEQDRIVHLRVNVQQIADDGIPFVFSDGHGIMELTKFYANLSQLARVDWDVVKARQWTDTIDQPDRKRRKQAEFLVHERLPLQYIEEIGVRSPQIRSELLSNLAFKSDLPPVNVRRDWYYE